MIHIGLYRAGAAAPQCVEKRGCSSGRAAVTVVWTESCRAGKVKKREKREKKEREKEKERKKREKKRKREREKKKERKRKKREKR